MIELKQVKKNFGKNDVLKGIDLQVSQGSIFGLLGPSGAGKTTIINIITGQQSVDEGLVAMMGKDIGEVTAEDMKCVGIMMDSFGVYERFNCIENLMVFARIYNIPQTRIYEVLEEVGLAEHAKTQAMKLSKGMKNRLQLARVFMQNPRIMFLDEPTSGLDPATAAQIHELILNKKHAGTTIFMTTHNMTEAYKLCDEIALLHEGVIVEKGSPEEICRRHYKEKVIDVLLKDNTKRTFKETELASLGELITQGQVNIIHSKEPDLETVFMKLTGKELYR